MAETLIEPGGTDNQVWNLQTSKMLAQMVRPLEGQGTLEIYVTGLDIKNKKYKISKMQIVKEEIYFWVKLKLSPKIYELLIRTSEIIMEYPQHKI